MYVEVEVQISSKSLDYTFTYEVPSHLKEKANIGKRVKIPFKNKILEGFIIQIKNKVDVSYKIKEIIDVIDEEVILNKEMFEIGDYISKKTLCTKIAAYQTMLPKALKAKINFNQNKKYNTYIVINKKCDNLSIKQQEIYDIVLKKEKILKKELTDISLYITNSLIKKEIFKEIKEEVYRLDLDFEKEKSNVILTEEQKKVINEIEYIYKPYLLHGITGSGKTEVYMQLIDNVINNNKQAIVLVPEISLTPQLVNIFKKRFGSIVAIMHSGLSEGEKYDEWRRIKKGEAKIAIGARSAIFSPFDNIGIIIIDEEHSECYKQENNPRYSAIDIALFRAKYHNAPLILGSATPSIESYTRAKIGLYHLLEMKTRINKKLPKVTLVDMKGEYRKGNKIISDLLKEKINEKLKLKEQIIILLNRRGYSTIISCHKCGHVIKCPNCDIPLTYHKKSNVLRCHYCSHAKVKINTCPSCNSDDINEFGIGTEKLEQYIKENFDARVIRMDIDTTSTKGAHEKIITAFKNKEYDILIGTQMISKGLDFPYVTLVGIINGDNSLNIPDFRSAEKTFQLLSQTSGRAGRSNLSGEVIIQGFNINHYSILYASNNDYESFYKEEMKIRKSLKYPPFYDLCLIKISGKDYENVVLESEKISKYLKSNYKGVILGPSPCNMPKINNIYYIQIIIKYKKITEIKEYLKFIQNKYLSDKKIQVEIDNNPIRL